MIKKLLGKLFKKKYPKIFSFVLSSDIVTCSIQETWQKEGWEVLVGFSSLHEDCLTRTFPIPNPNTINIEMYLRNLLLSEFIITSNYIME